MNNRTTIILVVAIVALLGVAAWVVLGQGTTADQAATDTSGQATQPLDTPEPAGPPTAVPEGTKPADYVESYYKAILGGDFAKAYGLQPATNKAQGDAASFQAQQEGYGLKGFEIGKTDEQGDTITVEGLQDLGANGQWVTVWTFENRDGELVVVSKRTGMQ